MPKIESYPSTEVIWLGDAKAETNAPVGMEFEEPNPEIHYDE